MSIVVLTIPGDAKRDFVNALHEKTHNAVKLVVMQKPKRVSLLKTMRKLYTSVGLYGLFVELWYAFLLRVQGDLRKALTLFRERTKAKETSVFIPEVIWVDDLNGEEVYKILKEIAPNLLVIWGTGIIRPHIIKTAHKAVNLHMGKCPEYRGAIANQYAFLHNDFANIGATIHYVEEKVDAGEILAQRVLDTTVPLQVGLRKLNDEAEQIYLELATRLYNGGAVPSYPQDISKGKNILLKEWIPSMRYKVAKKIIQTRNFYPH